MTEMGLHLMARDQLLSSYSESGQGVGLASAAKARWWFEMNSNKRPRTADTYL